MAAARIRSYDSGLPNERQRGALTAKERRQLDNAVEHTQGNGATARVIKQKGEGYVVHITNQDSQTITLIRVDTKAEVAGLSERYQWTPPWKE